VLTALNIQAQPPADSTPTYPQGATYTHSSGTATIIDSYSSSTQYYNVIQCTGGTLTMNGCTITKTGDGSQRGEDCHQERHRQRQCAGCQCRDSHQRRDGGD